MRRPGRGSRVRPLSLGGAGGGRWRVPAAATSSARVGEVGTGCPARRAASAAVGRWPASPTLAGGDDDDPDPPDLPEPPEPGAARGPAATPAPGQPRCGRVPGARAPPPRPSSWPAPREPGPIRAPIDMGALFDQVIAMTAPATTFTAALGGLLDGQRRPARSDRTRPAARPVPDRPQSPVRAPMADRAGRARPGVAPAGAGRGAGRHRAGVAHQLVVRAGLHDRAQPRVRPRAAVAGVPDPAHRDVLPALLGQRDRPDGAGRPRPAGRLGRPPARRDARRPASASCCCCAPSCCAGSRTRWSPPCAASRDAPAAVHRCAGPRRALLRLRHPGERGARSGRS